MIVIVAVSLSGLQGPGGSLVFKVRTIVPVKFRGGVYKLVKLFGSEKVPPLEEVQLPEEAAPPTVPFNCMVPFWQIVV